MSFRQHCPSDEIDSSFNNPNSVLNTPRNENHSNLDSFGSLFPPSSSGGNSNAISQNTNSDHQCLITADLEYIIDGANLSEEQHNNSELMINNIINEACANLSVNDTTNTTAVVGDESYKPYNTAEETVISSQICHRESEVERVCTPTQTAINAFAENWPP